MVRRDRSMEPSFASQLRFIPRLTGVDMSNPAAQTAWPHFLEHLNPTPQALRLVKEPMRLQSTVAMSPGAAGR